MRLLVAVTSFEMAVKIKITVRSGMQLMRSVISVSLTDAVVE